MIFAYNTCCKDFKQQGKKKKTYDGVGAAGGREASRRTKWRFCPNDGGSIRGPTSSLSQLNVIYQGTLIYLSERKQEVSNVIYKSA